MVGNKQVFLTEEGLQKLKERLDYLINVRRPEVAKQIHDAKADGDISENAGYDEAKSAQGFLEGEIQELNYKIAHAVIIRQNQGNGTVQLGSRVTVREGDFEPETYHIVGSAEADPFHGRISNVSPIGQALLNHSVNDIVQADTPGGLLEFEIIAIE